MPNDPRPHASPQSMRERSPSDPQPGPGAWRKPGFELIALDCEITAYAPDGDSPLV
jgi:hypothetical protein